MTHTPHILAVLASLAVLALVTFDPFVSLVAFATIFTLVAFLAYLAFVAFATFLRILAVVAFPTSIGLVAFVTFLAFVAVLTVVAPFTLVAVATWTAREPHSGADSSAERGTVARSTLKPIKTAVEEAPQQAAHQKRLRAPEFRVWFVMMFRIHKGFGVNMTSRPSVALPSRAKRGRFSLHANSAVTRPGETHPAEPQRLACEQSRGEPTRGQQL